MSKGNSYKIEVSLDASGISERAPGHKLKVLAYRGTEPLKSAAVHLDERGKGVASLVFEENPGAVRVAVGPAEATDAQLVGAQTLGMDVSPRRWETTRALALSITVPAFYWHWWLTWCRKFSVQGRVLCADGASPAPGVDVTAYDVRWWWWWSSRREVGTARTDANGCFTIDFTWCCGLWPWWWWRERFWRVEPALAGRIMGLLKADPGLRALPRLSPVPDLSVFKDLVGDPRLLEPPSTEGFNPAVTSSVRAALLRRLPASAELERLGVWPWWPWSPWWDCSPNLNFTGVQTCGDRTVVVIDEGLGDVRFDVPTSLSVSLTASSDACCIPAPSPRPPGGCMVFDAACSTGIGAIGGNYVGGTVGVVPGPRGYAYPSSGDRPFAASITLYGTQGLSANADYYEIEWAPVDSLGNVGTFATMPPAAVAGFTRSFWGPPLVGPGAVGQYPVTFAARPGPAGPGHLVIETQDHFEANNDPGSWGVTRWWMDGGTQLMSWLTDNIFADGTYALRLRAWNVSGTTWTSRILPLCDLQGDNGLLLTIENRPAVPDPGHPSDHPCGAGTVHTCTTQPDTDIHAVTINGSPVGPCAQLSTQQGDLVIDFFANDPNGHLDYYTLIATYGENLYVDYLGLVASSTATLVAGPVVGAIQPAAQVGPSYGQAISQGGARPTWNGGTLRLTVPAANLRLAFPEPCCYTLELRAYKRTIVSCGYDDAYQNLTQYTFQVID